MFKFVIITELWIPTKFMYAIHVHPLKREEILHIYTELVKGLVYTRVF
jgi:hypothetical protein